MNTLSELTSKLNTYDSTPNYSKIINLDLYNQISNNDKDAGLSVRCIRD